MKGFVVGLIVLGGICLVGGAAVLAYGMHKGNINDNFVENEHTFEEDVDDIKINVGTANVDIRKADDGKVKVLCTEKEKIYHEVKVSDKKLIVKEIDERKWYQKYLFNWNFKSMSVAVYLPEDIYNDIAVDAATGHISIDKDFTFANMNLSSDTGAIKVNSKATGDVEINVHTGDVTLSGVDAKSLKIKTSTGDIRAKAATIQETTTLQSSTGDVELYDLKGESLKAKTSTGHVELTGTVMNSDMNIETSTGHVKFFESDAKDIKVKTSTGAITGTLLTSKLFKGESSTGSVKFPEMSEWDQNGGTFEAKSDTGKIEIKIVK